MNITFTNEELAKFSNDMMEWGEKAIAHLLKELSANRHLFEMGNPLEFLQKRLLQYRETNPQPTWRSLL